MYLTHSWNDLDYVVCGVEIYMQYPHDIHWKDAKIIFHYAQGTKHFGIHYAASSPLELVGFTNFDWVRDSIDRNSTWVYVFILTHGPTCC